MFCQVIEAQKLLSVLPSSDVLPRQFGLDPGVSLGVWRSNQLLCHIVDTVIPQQQ